MFNNLRFELSFKNISDLEKKLSFCKSKKIKNINIPCKGLIKKEFYNSIIEYIIKYHEKLDVTYHYSLFHQYSINKENSYQLLLDFINKINSKKKYEILLVSGSNKKKNFDVINALTMLKNENNLRVKLGIAYNPYLGYYYNNLNERERYEKKISTGLVNTNWLQFGTNIKLLEAEFNYLKSFQKNNKTNFFGSILIPSKQFLARFKFRPWKEVFIDDKYLYSLDDFLSFTKDLIEFYIHNNITPVIETDISSSKKLDVLENLLKS